MSPTGLDRSFSDHRSAFALHDPHRCASDGRRLDELATRTYRHVLSDGPTSLDHVSRTLGCSNEDAAEAMMTLRHLRLVRHPGNDDDRFLAVCPEVAQAEVLLPLEETIHRQKHELTRLRQQLNPLVEVFDEHRLNGQTQSVVVAESAQEGRLRLINAVREARRELFVVEPRDSEYFSQGPARDLVLPLLDDALARDLDVRFVTAHTARTNPTAREIAAAIQAQGGQVRTVDTPYAAMIVLDREQAFVPGPATQGDTGRAVLCRDPTLADLFAAMFDSMWCTATDFHPEVNAYGHTLDELRRTMLQLLAAGLTDEAMARRLGVSPRTCRRHIAAIMETLQATSRFQAGVVASMSGLLLADAAPPTALTIAATQ